MSAVASSNRRVIVSIDAGTTSCRCILFSHRGTQLAVAQYEHAQICPAAARVEHDPEEIWNNVVRCIKEAMASAGVTPEQCAAVGITNQRETIVAWNATHGKTYGNAIVWQDQRGEPLCQELAARLGGRDALKHKTGTPIVSYFSATKLKWMCDNIPGLREDAIAGRARAGTIDSYLLWRLTGGAVHATDVTNASRTLLMNIHTCKWDPELCSLFDVPMAMLPEIQPSSHVFGTCSADTPLPGVPVAGILGDQQAALFGQACFNVGDAKNTYGTGCFLLMNTGHEPLWSTHGLLTTVAYQVGRDSKPVYALEGSVSIAGASVNWLRDKLDMISNVAEVEPLARSVPDNGGVVFVPAFNGLLAPHWRSDARGLIIGISGHTTKAHIARATLESVAFQTKDLLTAMAKDARKVLPKQEFKAVALRVDGGMTANQLFLQIQSDIIERPVVKPVVAETTALGAAYAAGLAVGVWRSTDELRAQWRVDSTYTPTLTHEEVNARTSHWHQAVQRSFNWEHVLSSGAGAARSSEPYDGPRRRPFPSLSLTSVGLIGAGMLVGLAIARVARSWRS